MTPEELEAEADRIAAQRSDSRTPAVVRRAIARPSALTLRKFLALEEAESPALSGKWKYGHAGAMAQDFCTAYAILFPDRKMLPPSELEAGISEICENVQQAFSTVMRMKFPSAPGAAAQPARRDGLGWVPRIWAQCGGRPECLDMPLEQLFMLAAAKDFLDGANCSGEDYKDRAV